MGAWYVPRIILTLFSNAYGASFELASVISCCGICCLRKAK